MHDVARFVTALKADGLASAFCLHCGQPTMLHRAGAMDDAPTGQAAKQLQIWRCPWCHHQSEARVSGHIVRVSRWLPSAR